MLMIRIIISIVLGFAIYWVIEFAISKIHGPIIDKIVVIFSPISIFGWVACLVIIALTYMLLGLVNWNGIGSTTRPH